MTAHLIYSHGSHIGYGRYGIKLTEALTRSGYDITETLTPFDRPQHLAMWVSTPNHVQGWFEGQRLVMSTMWETDYIPESFRDTFVNYHQMIVPSDQNKELFSRYHPNVAKVPLGVDSWDWRYRPRTPATDRFVFLISGNSIRKGVDLAYQAFQKVFRSWPEQSPRPVLIIKSPKPMDYVGERVQNITGRLSDEEEVELFASAHCYLQPSRGEGFGLMPLQAIAQGCPTILTDAHGHREFARLGWRVAANPSSSSDYMTLYGETGQWWEPDLDQLCARMLEVYRDYDLAQKEAKVSSDLAHQLFSWERCAERFVEAVGEEHFYGTYRGTGVWKEPELIRYPVRVTKFWPCEIANVHYHFTPGVTYHEVADVKRILYEVGVLDPSCVSFSPEGEPTPAETGLTPKQLESFGEYSASHSYCHACGQKLGTGEIYQPPEYEP